LLDATGNTVFFFRPNNDIKSGACSTLLQCESPNQQQASHSFVSGHQKAVKIENTRTSYMSLVTYHFYKSAYFRML